MIRKRNKKALTGIRRSLLVLAAAGAMAAAKPALAAESEGKPLWEAGLGVGGVSFPSYRGADDHRSYLLPVPLFYYHGDYIKSDRHGVRGRLFDSERVDLNVSFALSPPVSSDSVSAREGMPRLASTLEFGPQLDLLLWRSNNHARSLKLQVPLRTAYTLEKSPKQVGWVLHPKLNLDVTDVAGFPGWNVGLQAGPVWGDARQNAHFYSVAEAYATAERPAYEARAGYAGMQYLMAVSKRFSGFWVGAFLRYDNLSGAVFEDSPLVKQRDYLAAGFGITWVLGASSERVRREED